MAANQVTVSTPGPAGAVGVTYEGGWTVDDVYQVRDCVRFTDGNLYFCNVQHTASSSNTPVLNSTYWTIFINADDAFQWATKAKHTSITDSLGNTGYSALHQAAKAADWAKLTTDAVTNDANSGDVDYSAKAWAIGGTEVTTTASRGAAKEWATTVGGKVDGGSGDYSSKEYAIGTTASTGGSAKDWATYTAADVRGAGSGDMSAKEWAVGVLGRGVAGEGSAKDWATRVEDSTVDNAGYSALHHAAKSAASATAAASSATGGSGSATAAAASATAANASADAVSEMYDAFHDFYLGSMSDAVTFTGSSSSGLLITSAAHGLVDTQVIRVANTGGALPGNLSASTDYYVRDKTANNFKLATSSGGTAIAHSSDGSGTNTWYHADFATPSSSSWPIDSSVITVASNVGIRVGQLVTGSGIPTSPKPNVVSIVGTAISISKNMAAAGSSVAVTFANKGVYGAFDTTKDGPSTNNDGEALADGVKYFNTTDDVMLVYDETSSAWKRMQPTTTEQGHINTVSGIQANVTTVAGISANVTTIAGISANVTTVAGISGNVTTVAGISSDVTAVAADASDIGAVAAKATEIGRLGTADAVADMVLLGTTDCVADMALLGTSDCVADMALLGTTACIADMALLGTSDCVADMAILGTSDIVADMALLGTSDCVTDMALLGTSACVADMAILGTSDVVADLNTLGTSDVVADLNTLGTADVVADLNTLGTADVVSDMNTLGTGGNVTNMNTLAGIAANITTVAGISANVTTVAGISANVTTVAGVSANVTTVATNIADVNNFADVYQIDDFSPSAPTTDGGGNAVAEGDLAYDSTANRLKYYNGSSWELNGLTLTEVQTEASNAAVAMSIALG